MHYYFEAFKKDKFANFKGRSQRAEYWTFILVNLVINVVLSIISAVINPQQAPFSDPAQIINYIFAFVTIVPSFALGVRRLHDTGKSGWLLVGGLIIIFGSTLLEYASAFASEGAIITVVTSLGLIVFFAQKSQPGTNKYGPNPKEGALVTAE